jgi:nicotinamidase-related amidase
MSPVLHLQAYRTRQAPMLVLVDLQQEHRAAGRDTEHALANCRLALAHARAKEMPVAFVRRMTGSPLAPEKPSSSWIEGFQPWGVDMIFERRDSSCYASANFDEVITRAGGYFAFAGLGGESSGLATAVDAAHRGHRVTYLSDASVSNRLGDIASGDVHRVVAEIIAGYGERMSTERWIKATSALINRDRGEERERVR